MLLNACDIVTGAEVHFCAIAPTFQAVTNDYSDSWYATFLNSIIPESTRSEVDFVARFIPAASHPYLLDLCCGSGRHATSLVEKGYQIMGVDANAQAIERARAACPQGRFVVGDMRALTVLGETFDGVVNLWHSFGYFDDETNQEILRQVHDVLRPGGRAIFDIYNRDHFGRRPAVEIAERAGKIVHTSRSWDGPRQRVTLSYDGAVQDTFEWRLYSPREFEDACRAADLQPIVTCAWCDESIPAAPEHARMQFVLECRA